MFADAHCHLYDYNEACRAAGQDFNLPQGLYCASAHDRSEFLWQEDLALQRPGDIALSFGIHPQLPVQDEWEFLVELALAGRIKAIGEAGFDLFTAEYKGRLEMQTVAFDAQLGLAEARGLPLVLHVRKALPQVFTYAQRLKRLPAVVFHSWPGSPEEARALRARGVNAYFSLGKPILNGNKRARLSAARLPLECLLLETDAPYQTLRAEEFTAPADIRLVYAQAALLRDIPGQELEAAVEANFRRAYALP
jgi:TatD DNase family protein